MPSTDWTEPTQMKLRRLTISRGSAPRRLTGRNWSWTQRTRLRSKRSKRRQHRPTRGQRYANRPVAALHGGRDARGASAAGAGRVSVNGLSRRGERDRAVPEYQLSDLPTENKAFGGRGEIRTHETVSRLAVFKTAALNHSATLPASIHQAQLDCQTANNLATRTQLDPSTISAALLLKARRWHRRRSCQPSLCALHGCAA